MISNKKLNPFFLSLDLELSDAKNINCEANSDDLNIKDEPAGNRGSVMSREQLFTIAFHFYCIDDEFEALGSCWQKMLLNPVVITRDPVRARPYPSLGLGISVDKIAALAGTDYMNIS